MRMIKNNLLFILMCLFSFAGCSNYYYDLSVNNNKKSLSDPAITFFSFHPDENSVLSVELEARIKQDTSEIIIIAPVGSNITANELNSRFTTEGLVYVNGKMQISGSNEHLYKDSVVYEVKSANGKNKKKYTVTVREHNSTIYVNTNASNNGDGSSWTRAFKSLRDAIELAELFPESKSKEIWIAAGTYKPGAGNNTEHYFPLTANTSYIGGFAGNETNINQRVISFNRTIISGDLGSGKYSYNLFGSFDDNIVNSINRDITFDGIEFMSAKASSELDIRKFGTAINVFLDSEAALKIVNCVFNILEGSAIFALNGNAFLTDTVFNNITANDIFGAVYIDSENAEVKGCVFKNITGSALSINGSIVSVENTQFSNITGAGAGSQALFVNSTSTDGSVIIKDLIIDGVSGGRGIYVTSYNSVLITETEIHDCSVASHGGGIYLNNFGQAEISFTDFFNTTAIIGGSIFYMGEEENSSLLLIDIRIDYAAIKNQSHQQMHLDGENITVR